MTNKTAICANCEETKKIKARGLCSTCYEADRKAKALAAKSPKPAAPKAHKPTAKNVAAKVQAKSSGPKGWVVSTSVAKLTDKQKVAHRHAQFLANTKGKTFPRGSTGKGKLSVEDIQAIRRDPRSARAIAEEYDITFGYVGTIWRGQTHGDIPWGK